MPNIGEAVGCKKVQIIYDKGGTGSKSDTDVDDKEKADTMRVLTAFIHAIISSLLFTGIFLFCVHFLHFGIACIHCLLKIRLETMLDVTVVHKLRVEPIFERDLLLVLVVCLHSHDRNGRASAN